MILILKKVDVKTKKVDIKLKINVKEKIYKISKNKLQKRQNTF